MYPFYQKLTFSLKAASLDIYQKKIKLSSFIFVPILQLYTKVTDELKGQLMQVHFYSRKENTNQKSDLGFTVVKFVGERYCKYVF